VIAEDPLAGFLPSSGIVRKFVPPEFARVDTWVREGTVVSPYYDSLLAKVVSHAPSRAAAAGNLARALTQFQIDGVRHNVDLLLATVESPAFLSGELHTRFLEEHHVIEKLAEIPSRVMAAASAIDHLRSWDTADPWHATTGWRLGRVDQPTSWSRAGRLHAGTVSARVDGGGVDVQTGSTVHAVRLLGPERVGVDGEAATVTGDDFRVVQWQGRTYRLQRTPPPSVEETAGDRGAQGGSGSLVAPIPGRVVKLAARVGQQITQNQPLLVLEAMKMEHVVEAPHTGVVLEICVSVGDQVATGQRLLTIGSAEETQPVE
jgi:3-methylcrotonyl-CoA carboxylase alpha subunit